MSLIIHRLRKIVRNMPSLFLGHNIYVDTNKLRLIDRVFRCVQPSAMSFADLGGVWKVNGAYSLYALKKHSLDRGILVDTDFPDGLFEKLSRIPRLHLIKGNFANADVVHCIGMIDVVFFFDVLVHQANPSWDAILSIYAEIAPCLVIYNQQYVFGNQSVRLTDLPIEKYMSITSRRREEFCRYVYAHADEIHPTYGKPWRDVHNIFQWGITDQDIRTKMAELSFREVYFQNCGRFSNLEAFENHAFIFVRD